MSGRKVMLIAGEASGDLLAAELVTALRKRDPQIECFGAGGSQMIAAGVDLALDMTQHAVIGLWEAIRKYFEFRQMLHELLVLAIERKPDVIVCVDFGGFNSRFAAALRDYHRHHLAHLEWRPKLVQFVSPQVWASRPGRADNLAKNFDQLLCILPFEKAWWNQRLPDFPVNFVGHPIVGRHRMTKRSPESPVVALMPGSRQGELRKHLPTIVEAARRIGDSVSFRMLLPSEEALQLAQPFIDQIPNCSASVGKPATILNEATVALSKTGTITLECALFGVPTVTFYQTSALTYAIGKRVVTVPYLSMPNLLANEEVFPEFVQDDATPENLAAAVTEFLNNQSKRTACQQKLKDLVATLGKPGAPDRAAKLILDL
ncbi:MAG: lipid-A-disaccharide synthase [Limisphaerales bacterium]